MSNLNQFDSKAATPPVVQAMEKEVDAMFTYQPWTAEQANRGEIVRGVLADAVKAILREVPPSADRSTAIRKIREARMDCNSAITHGGKY